MAAFSSKSSYEFKPLFDVILATLRERNAASGGEEMLRLRAYEKLQSLVSQGAVNRTVNGTVKKYKGEAKAVLLEILEPSRNIDEKFRQAILQGMMGCQFR